MLAAAWCLAGSVAIALRLVALRRLTPILGRPIGAVACIPLADARQTERARKVRRAVLRAARIAPFRCDCLPQALAAAILCRLLGVPASAHIGVRRGAAQDAFAAHAWVCSGSEAVSGGPSFGAYAPLACFVPRRYLPAVVQ